MMVNLFNFFYSFRIWTLLLKWTTRIRFKICLLVLSLHSLAVSCHEIKSYERVYSVALCCKANFRSSIRIPDTSLMRVHKLNIMKQIVTESKLVISFFRNICGLWIIVVVLRHFKNSRLSPLTVYINFGIVFIEK